MDKFEALVKNASFAVVLLHNAATEDFELVGLEPVGLDTAQCFTGRGLGFAGIMGVVDGQARIALAEPIIVDSRITDAFCQRLEDELNSRIPTGESTEWLRRLWSIPDTRTN